MVSVVYVCVFVCSSMMGCCYSGLCVGNLIVVIVLICLISVW